MKFELLIENNGIVQMPLVIDGVTWATERKGAPGKLTFTVAKDNSRSFTEGNSVSLTVDRATLFSGFIFTKKHDKKQDIAVTAYDQLRYLTNKDTYIYTNKTASQFIKTVADDFKLRLGTIERTGYNIPSRVEDNTTLLDMIHNALDLELTNRRQMFVLYDAFGKLTLKNIANMKVPLIVDEETGENFDYTSTIDEQTYNKVKLSFENEETGKRDIYVAQDGSNINRWGVLQYFDTLKEGENGNAKAAALLDLYNAKTRKLKITKAFGDTRVRAGSLVIVKLDLGDVKVQNYMLVEKCTHDFYNVDDFNFNTDTIDSALIKSLVYQCNGVDDDVQIENIINNYTSTDNQALTMKLIISGKFGASRLQGDTNPLSYNSNNVLLAIRIKSPGYSVKTLFLNFDDCDIPEYIHSQTSLLGYEDRNLKVYIEGLQMKSIAPPILLASAPDGTNYFEPTILNLFKCHIDSYYNCLGKDGSGAPRRKYKINCQNCFFANSRNSNQRLLSVSDAPTFRISNCSFEAVFLTV